MEDSTSQQTLPVSHSDSPTPTKPATTKCFASRHMLGMTYAIYDMCRALSGKTGILYCSGDTLVKCFLSMSPQTAYRHIDLLEAQGWLKLVKGSVRKSNGHNSARHFKVLSHDEWAKTHPKECEKPLSQSVLDDEPLHLMEQPLHIMERPLSQSVHISVKHLSKANLVSRTIPGATLLNGVVNQAQHGSAEARQSGGAQPPISNGVDTFSSLAPVDELVDRFGSRRKRRTKDTIVVVEPSPAIPPAPVITPATLARAVGEKFGFISPLQTAPWETTIQRIADRGNDVDTIHGVLSYYYRKHADIMDREGVKGFEVAFPRLLSEYTQEQLQTMNVPNGGKEQNDPA